MPLPSTLTTELEAVNIVLQACEEAPVQSLDLAGLYPLDHAKQCMAEASRAVQSGGWAFNTEDEVTLTPDGGGLIALPANMLRFDAEDEYSRKPIQRGLRLYDAKAHSYVFTKAVKGTALYLLGWDELPQAARHYITIRAARTMQGRSAVSDSTYRYTEEDVQGALLAMSESEAAVGDHNMLTDSWSVGSVIYGREML